MDQNILTGYLLVLQNPLGLKKGLEIRGKMNPKSHAQTGYGLACSSSSQV